MKRTQKKKEFDNFSNGEIRLNKYLANAGVCSRRHADELIQSGRVQVNGEIISELGCKVNPAEDNIFVDGSQVVILDEPIYIIFNKPKDCITTASDDRGRTTVMDYVKIKRRVYPVGRLDRKTSGVLLLTNDGDFANKLMHPKQEIAKTYKVTLDKALAIKDAERLSLGVRLSDGTTAPAKLHMPSNGKNKIVLISIKEGRNRQIHRMFEALGYKVDKLDRISYANVTYDGLACGQWRHLTKTEVYRLKEQMGLNR
jgi:23S rRNA pseudouridine2605 synthase